MLSQQGSLLAKEANEFLIGIQGQKRKAKVLAQSAYDPENKMLKSCLIDFPAERNKKVTTKAKHINNA